MKISPQERLEIPVGMFSVEVSRPTYPKCQRLDLNLSDWLPVSTIKTRWHHKFSTVALFRPKLLLIRQVDCISLRLLRGSLKLLTVSWICRWSVRAPRHAQQIGKKATTPSSHQLHLWIWAVVLQPRNNQRSATARSAPELLTSLSRRIWKTRKIMSTLEVACTRYRSVQTRVGQAVDVKARQDTAQSAREGRRASWASSKISINAKGPSQEGLGPPQIWCLIAWMARDARAICQSKSKSILKECLDFKRDLKLS